MSRDVLERTEVLVSCLPEMALSKSNASSHKSIMDAVGAARDKIRTIMASKRISRAPLIS